MFWDALPYASLVLVVITLIFVLVLMGIMAWECRQNPRVMIESGELPDTILLRYQDRVSSPFPIDAEAGAYRVALVEIGMEDAYDVVDHDLTEHMDTLKDPVDLFDPIENAKAAKKIYDGEKYRTNFGREMDR